MPFLAFFDFQEKSVLELTVQKDAPGPVSPLRFRIGRVWALGAWFGAVFGFFDFRKNPFLRRRSRKMRQVRFPPFGSVLAAFGLRELRLAPFFGVLFISGKLARHDPIRFLIFRKSALEWMV